ncbi:hypothetical protein EVAR_65916_1 [Eumeta japonica]|uniref:Uncharacterized protein n=1 Tax=Eumeta variegata TaxID=151549 RepID=A0A4C2AE45_EUMVA|nr:hypothetical protein EVAR_65916_1 [Eumeta japonica]
MASDVGVIDSTELEPYKQPSNLKNNENGENLASTSNRPNTATLAVIKPNSASVISLSSDNEDTHTNLQTNNKNFVHLLLRVNCIVRQQMPTADMKRHHFYNKK